MKSLIVCTSTSHGNKRRVADRIAEVLQADVVTPDDVDADTIADYDVVGFGSGIYFMAVHPSLLQLIRGLPQISGVSAFTFFTSGSRELPVFRYSSTIRRELAAKGFKDLGSFSCRGFDAVGPLRFVGGVNKGRPNADDLDKAAAFASKVRDALTTKPPHADTGARRSRRERPASRTGRRSQP